MLRTLHLFPTNSKRFIRGTDFCLLIAIIVSLQSVQIASAQTISVNKNCVKTGETFAVSFQNVNPQVDDWIGILPVSENTNRFTNFNLWAWTCGTQTCTTSAASGRVRFRANSNLPTGSYRAVLAHDSDNSPPWKAYAVSKTFTVATSCPATAPTPVAVPISKPVSKPVPTSTGSNAAALGHLKSARGEIETIIRNDKRLAPQFIRMAFHDCIGGCDGTCYTCISLPQNIVSSIVIKKQWALNSAFYCFPFRLRVDCRLYRFGQS
jgi:Peroxidase